MVGITVGTARCLLQADSLGITTVHLVGAVPHGTSEFVSAAILRRVRELNPAGLIYRLERAESVMPELVQALAGVSSGRLADAPAACVGTEDLLPMLREATRAMIATGLMRRSFSCPRVAYAWIAEEIALARLSGTSAQERPASREPQQSPPAPRPFRTD